MAEHTPDELRHSVLVEAHNTLTNERDRLRALNAELLAALDRIMRQNLPVRDNAAWRNVVNDMKKTARNAIERAKAEDVTDETD